MNRPIVIEKGGNIGTITEHVEQETNFLVCSWIGAALAAAAVMVGKPTNRDHVKG
jgi:hypothetical protein